MRTCGLLAIEGRRQRLTLAMKILMAKKEMVYDEAITLISYNLGVTSRKAMEYIDTFISMGAIKKEGANITISVQTIPEPQQSSESIINPDGKHD